MSGSVTPARRRRDEVDSDVEDFEPSIDGEGSARSNGSKRTRLDDNVEEDMEREDGEPEHEHGDVLPDSFRRSPKTRGRAVDMLTNGDAPQEHHPGSVVRVALTNFVTYTRAEFHPGPNLNMIIGPNGTGKSTLVCAICLGLGWSTSHLGRAKDLGEFVKHGAKRAEIEIELARDPSVHQVNPVITTGITKDGNKADYAINKKKSNKKSVQELARSFSIQVDNLCQFLPQDRVVEFAALSPEDLLIQTQRAAAPEYMTEWHEQLKEWRKEQRATQHEQQRLMETLKQDENRQRLQEADVERLRERSTLQERKRTLEMLRPFPEYAVAKQRHAEAKVRRKEAEKELRQLQRNLEPNLRAVESKNAYLGNIEKAVGMRQRLVQRQETTVSENKKKCEDMQTRIARCAAEILSEKSSSRVNNANADRFRREIAQLEKAIQSPPEPFDAAQMNEQMRDLTRQLRELESRGREIKQEVASIDEQRKQRHTIIERCRQEKDDLQSQAGQQANKLKSASRDAAAAWEWIQANRDKFEGEVFGPPIIECTLKDQRNAAAVESIVLDGEKLAFTVTTQKDFRTLNEQVYDVLKLSQVNIRNSPHPLASFRNPIATEQLEQYGLQCWILDLIEGPEPVLAMLCDNARIQSTAYTSGEISQAQYEALSDSLITSFVTSKQTYQIVRRREYGPQATSTRVNSLKQPRFFTDTPVDRQQEEAINAREREAIGELQELKQKREELAAEGRPLGVQRVKLEEEKDEILARKNDRQRQHADFNALPAKVQRAQEKLNEAEEQRRGSRGRIREIVERGDGLTVTKGQLVLDYVNSIDALRGLHVQLFEAEILQIEAKSDHDQLQAQHAEEQALLEQRQLEVVELERVKDQLLQEGKRLQDQCRAVGAELTAEENEVYNEVDNGQWSPDQMETEIQSVQARLDMTHGGGNQNTLREFEERATRIEVKRSKLNDIEAKLRELFAEIEELRGRWEPKLDDLVSQISEAFAENFSRIECAGEVAVHKDDDFEEWAIQIKVKFRETEQLSILDSHRQSGGERAVSTIFYLMALQSLARAPFRVVDEINQGMDPRNERLVHSRMVDIACAERTSQYFLITPKLLSGLKYHPNMKVHCIASGEYMPGDYEKLDFGALAKKALSIRRGDANVAVAG